MRKINHFTSVIFFDNLFAKSNLAKNLFGPDAGGGLGSSGGIFGSAR